MIDLMQGDCHKLMEKISDNQIDLIVCDMPYGITNNCWDKTLDLSVTWSHINRITTENAAVILSSAGIFTSRLIQSNEKNYRYEWIVEKTSATGHLNAKKMPLRAHEIVNVFYRKPPIYNPQKTSGHPRKSAIKRYDNGTCYGKTNKITKYDSTERYPRSVLKLKWDKQELPLNPTQKPVAFYDYFIKTYSNENMTVLDFTMGSGTCGISCLNLNRNFIGIELDSEQFNIAKNRIKQHELSIHKK